MVMSHIPYTRSINTKACSSRRHNYNAFIIIFFLTSLMQRLVVGKEVNVANPKRNSFLFFQEHEGASPIDEITTDVSAQIVR